MFNIIGLGGGEILFLLLAPFFLAVFVFWIWMLVSAIQNNGLTGTEKVVWVLVIIFLHFLGAFLYFLLGHPKRLHSTNAAPPT
jgi:hypothetical protein